MRFLPRWSRELGLAAVLLAAALPGEAWAKPDPNYKPKGGFRLMASALNIFTGNKVQCALLSSGQVCAPVSSTIGGGYWPAGTNNQYIFNTGLQIAGVFDPASSLPWAGSTDGAFFFNARGGGNGQAVTQVFNSADPADLAAWPDAAFVPTDALFDPALQGRKTASDNDAWFLSWEGDPAQNAGRTHPLGVLVETRGLAYNSPGKTDFLFFIFTIYNVTASDPAAYAAYASRPAIQQILIQYGAKFQALNEGKFGAGTIPDAGYAIKDAFVAFGADMDVTFENSGNDYDGVNVPFSMGYTYEAGFTAPGSWTFDPGIYKPPFFAGAGFVGVKYLKSPVDPGSGNELGLTLFGATSNGGNFSDPVDTKALYRYLSGHLDPNQQDDQCNVGDVALTKICYINQGTPDDMRFFQASGPLDLGPGESQTIAVAYILAPPVASGACTGPDVCNEVRPQAPTGDLTRMTNVAALASGANTVDTITGFAGFLGDLNANGKVDADEIKTVPGSLLGKAGTAQGVFDAHFVQPSPPAAPNFFLIPGDQQVTIVWKQSATDSTFPGSIGDPYYASAKGNPALYDPNYRKFDVEGYRVYRGRTGDQGSLKLLAQFDYAGTTFVDSLGIVNQIKAGNFSDCGPQLGPPVFSANCTDAGINNGLQLVGTTPVPIVGDIIQNKNVIASGTGAYVTLSDTAVTGEASGRPTLKDTGVPFVFVDKAGACSNCGVTNGQKYFYVVTAFDINSVFPGAGSSLESSGSLTKEITPTRIPTNTVSSGSLGTPTLIGDAGPVATDLTLPTIDPVKGTFSKPFPPADGLSLGLAAFVPQLLAAPGTISVTLDSMDLGSAYDVLPNTYYLTAASATTGETHFVIPLTQDQGSALVGFSSPFAAIKPDPVQAKKFGGNASFTISGLVSDTLIGSYNSTAFGRGCINAAAGAVGFVAGLCSYNGPRWFDGPSPTKNEVQADPIAGNQLNASPPLRPTSFANAGKLTGVAVIHQPHAYQTQPNVWRQIEGAIGGAARAADFNLTWGAGGTVTSVHDVTHDVDVPFRADLLKGATWGFLNQADANDALSFDARTVLTLADFGCVPPLKTFGSVGGAAGILPCGATTYSLSNTAVPGPIAHFGGGAIADAKVAAIAPGPGFAIYLAGQIFMFELPPGGAVPAAGTVWTMRSYTGAVNGGHGDAGDEGNYSYAKVGPRPFTAVGAGYEIAYSATNVTNSAVLADIKSVHTVPDPYYVTSAYENSVDNKIIKFVNLPTRAIIRIYSASGVLVRVLEHVNRTSNEEIWDVRNRGGQFVASGVYFWHVESGAARRVGRMTVVNFAK